MRKIIQISLLSLLIACGEPKKQDIDTADSTEKEVKKTEEIVKPDNKDTTQNADKGVKKTEKTIVEEP